MLDSPEVTKGIALSLAREDSFTLSKNLENGDYAVALVFTPKFPGASHPECLELALPEDPG